MTQYLQRGQRARLDAIGAGSDFIVELSLGAGGPLVDCACFGLDGQRKLSDERYMTFFNQPQTPCGGVAFGAPGRFTFHLAALPVSIEVLTITLAIDGQGQMSQLPPSHLDILANGQAMARFDFSGALFAGERAVMLFEFYRKDGAWRLCPVGQGFDGGLDALVTHFGGEVAVPSPAPISAPSPAKVSLEKRIEKEAPQLVSLVKQAKVSLEKTGLGRHRARVCLCLDISGSMHTLYKQGAVQRFAERVLALACHFDDDGEIDVFLFGANVHHPEPLNLGNCRDYIAGITRRHVLEGDTRYGKAMGAIRDFYFDPSAAPGTIQCAEIPVYVMFVTDGSTSDKTLTERQLRESSFQPIFWQFMGIGKGRKSRSKLLMAFTDSSFPFLEKLDELPGRLLDNAAFFSVERPDEHTDDALYDLLMEEYPEWVKAAKAKGMFS